MEVANQHEESKTQLQERYNKQYALVRGLNQLLSAFDFGINTGPYPVHVVYDESQKMLWIEGDNTFSWIDIKSTDFRKAYNKLSSIIEEISNPDAGEKNGISLISQKSKDIAKSIFNVIYEKIGNQSRKRPKVIVHNPNKIYKAILRKLYNDTLTQSDRLRDKNTKEGERETIDLSQEGREYFSHIIADLYHYYHKTSFLGTDREEWVFPQRTFTTIRTKLYNKEVLSTEEICELVEHLINNKTIDGIDGIYDDAVEGHHAKGLKKLMVNQLWAMLYDEQSYNYYTIEQLSQGRSDRNKDEDDALKRKLSANDNDLFTESGYKGLASMASKELRRTPIEDMLRSRTWIISDKMNSKDIGIIFTHQIDQLKEHFKGQGYEVIIDKITVVNKFRGEQGINITNDDVNTIQNTLNESNMLTGESDTDKESSPSATDSNTYAYNIGNAGSIDTETQGIIKNAIKKDIKKTGGNGIYEDIKIRVSYRLKTKDGDILESTGGYEHMIVNMSSCNECGLSDHNIILDPKKTIVNMIRTKSHIGIDEFIRLISGGLDTTIKQLLDWKDKLYNNKINGGRRTFIERQYPLRNAIPSEIIDLANKNVDDDNKINMDICYTDLDTKPAIKKRIERAVTTYIINELFSSGVVQWYFYDNDNIDGHNQIIQDKLKDKMYFSQPGREELIQKALTSRHPNEYRICGGGSQNLTSALRNGTLSPNAIIGIPHNGSIMYIKVATLAGILSDSMKTPTASSIKQSAANEILEALKGKKDGIPPSPMLF